MLDESGSIKCEVIVDGELLPEYNDNLDDDALVDADPNTMETYVEAETGKKFECRVVFQKGWKKVFKVHDSEATLWVNGIHCINNLKYRSSNGYGRPDSIVQTSKLQQPQCLPGA